VSFSTIHMIMHVHVYPQRLINHPNLLYLSVSYNTQRCTNTHTHTTYTYTHRGGAWRTFLW